MSKNLIIRRFPRQDYLTCWQAMRQFTDERNHDTSDELWLLEHPPVFTQGQAGKAEHILMASDIPVVQTDRGGQVTYHGPGQLMAYCLTDCRRAKIGIKQLVNQLEQTIISYLASLNISAERRCKAPGVYVDDAKICSLGLRIRQGASYHGIAFNINMDLTPFQYINPCGFANLTMTDVHRLGGPKSIEEVIPHFVECYAKQLGYQQLTFHNHQSIGELHDCNHT